MGCTIGQGITGTSTLVLGVFLTLGAIILGSALSMKVQYCKLVCEEEASFPQALVADRPPTVAERLAPPGQGLVTNQGFTGPGACHFGCSGYYACVLFRTVKN